MKSKKEKRGGTRKGAGAKHKFGEPTATIAFRVPGSKVDEARKFVNSMLEKWIII